MKRLTYFICAIGIAFGSFSCSDMLESDSSRQVFEPGLNQKTDSIFYAFGILQAMQELADQYVFQGEMRGDLVTTTYYTDNNLRQLANFSATTANKYDSAYVYYRVINNCNYYIAHRDTTLLTGATNVVINEYAAVKAIRAWAYLQLVRNYGRVPFFTEPLTKISQIDNNRYPELDLAGIVAQLAPDLERYTGFRVPTFGNYLFSVGSTNSGSEKLVYAGWLFIPVDVVLGDLYLENGDYDKAASHYTTYLTQVGYAFSPLAANFSFGRRQGGMGLFNELPADWDSNTLRGASDWSDVFDGSVNNEIISYIPMAVNRLRGATTDVPLAFGYNYYATREDAREEGMRVDEIQIQPSASYLTLSDSTDYYYYARLTSTQPENSLVKSTSLGDMRANSIMTQGTGEDSTKIWVEKYNSGNIILYRVSTVLLHLAEAYNRMGHPDLAFAILKDGISQYLLTDADYISEESKQVLQSGILSTANISRFDNAAAYFGIHCHGAGVVRDYNGSSYIPGLSPYRPESVIGKKMAEIARQFNVNVGTSKQDSINAMEDLLCDEYALELAFEGNRWPDLMRLARHKNEAGLYDANFGSRWLAAKLAYKSPVVSLEDKNNWYLPFK